MRSKPLETNANSSSSATLTLVSADPSGSQYKASLNEPLKTQRFFGRLLLLVGVLVSVAFLVPVKAVPDFGISADPSSVAGPSLSSTITLTSLGGFSGSVNVSASVYPSGPSISLTSVVSSKSVILDLPAGGSASTPLFATSYVSGNFTITVTGVSGSISHSVPVIVEAQPLSADFNIDCCFPLGNGDMGRVSAGENYTSWGWVTSINHFSGVVNLTATLNLNVQVSIKPSTVIVPEAGMVEPTITFRVPTNATVGRYTGLLTSTNGSITHTEALTLTVDPPLPACPTCFPSVWSPMTILSAAIASSSVGTGVVFPRINKNPQFIRLVANVVLGSSLVSIGVIVTLATGLILLWQGWLGLTCIRFWKYGFPFTWREILGCGNVSQELNWYAFAFDTIFFTAVGYMAVFSFHAKWRGRVINPTTTFLIAAVYVAVAIAWFGLIALETAHPSLPSLLL